MGKPKTSIKSLIKTTAVIAVWFGLRGVAFNEAWLLLGVLVLAVVAIHSRNPLLWFWSPLVYSLSFVLLSFVPWWTTPQDSHMWFCAVALSLVAITTFTILRTRAVYKNHDSREGVVFYGMGQSSLAGLYVGFMFSLPRLIANCISAVVVPQSYVGLEFGQLMSLPILGLVVGFVFGFFLGFACDILVGFDFRNRSHTKVAA